MLCLVIFTEMSDHQYKSGVWNYLGLSIGPVNPGALRCQCGTLMSDPDHPHMCAPWRCKNWLPRYMQKRMVPRNATRRHVCVQAAKETAPPFARLHGAPLPGSQGYGNRGDLLTLSLTRMVELDVTFVHTTGTAGRTQGAQGGRQECQDQRRFKKKAPCEGRHIWVYVRNAGA